NRISKERWVELCSTTPARMFGLYPRKGVVAPGSDADLVVYDPNGHTSIGLGKTHHMNMDHSAWEGYEISGHVDTVLSRGSVVVDGGEFLGRAGHGQFLKRGLSQYLQSGGRSRGGAGGADGRRCGAAVQPARVTGRGARAARGDARLLS